VTKEASDMVISDDAISFSLLLQMGIVYLGFVQPIFKTEALNLFD